MMNDCENQLAGAGGATSAGRDRQTRDTLGWLAGWARDLH